MILPLGFEANNLYLGIFFILAGGVIGVLALLENKLGNFNIRPDIKENSSLVTTGIYAYIRHPMYASALLIMFAFVLFYPGIYESVLYLLLVLTLLVKLTYEESLWKRNSKDYEEYVKNTYRIIPFIF
jgi:protein-S-isoprenylcysteine O-methyltransferase Ste14